MSQLVRKTLGIVISMAVLSTVIVVGSQSFVPYPASGSPARPQRLPVLSRLSRPTVSRKSRRP